MEKAVHLFEDTKLSLSGFACCLCSDVDYSQRDLPLSSRNKPNRTQTVQEAYVICRKASNEFKMTVICLPRMQVTTVGYMWRKLQVEVNTGWLKSIWSNYGGEDNSK